MVIVGFDGRKPATLNVAAKDSHALEKGGKKLEVGKRSPIDSATP
jgi:hypothetical protein